ncbi:MAG TPA: DNA-processing protein DprA [Desulfobacterales bacterium]|nr:DNA-processing protein DprA [Desulfobacterales bacterium]
MPAANNLIGRQRGALDDILSWFQLKSVPGVGNLLFKRLIERFGTPAAALTAARDDLLAVEGVGQHLADAIRHLPRPAGAAAEFERAQSRGCRIVTLTDPGFPPLLREIPDPPPFLYVRGELSGCPRPIAVVGSRNATAYGVETTLRICRDLAGLGFTVVSGMALGIDAAAHEGALSGQGRTVAVLGSGLDNIYPPQHRRLAERIAAGGAVISEFPLQAGPEAHHFPVRNRIISGMSFGTVVVEATKDSGSLITARLAAEQNREVFAVPGSIQSFKSMGTHVLIKQGAKLVENVQDIVAELGHFLQDKAPLRRETASVAPRHRLTAEEAAVAAALTAYPVHIDDLVRKLAMEPGHLSGILLQLELKGIVTQLPGKLFVAAGADRSRTP